MVSDKNGERGDNETLVKGVKVRLVNRADKSVVRETVCDDKGYYLFDELPAGQYDIMFAGPDGDNWNYYKATAVKAQGVDESRNSDGVSVTQGTLKDGAKIELVELPALDKMVTSRFVINDMDLGVVRLVQLNTMPTTGSMPWLAVIVVTVLFVNIAMIAVLLKVTKKENDKVVRLVQLNTMPTTGSMPWLAVIVVTVLFVNIAMIAVLLKVTKKENDK